ncbi:GerMN domain-containing protein [Clostridium sp.]|uniref:GerMN domain-containing protein n=1 Tax=Clostridium sp. TaxID=1506 RepID=UPI001B478F6C|nr:GerMN domain-containing protein [Clostridium sp.]MBP3914925.1 GerMN domain-containing protein [Clostridium sp.]MEE0932146.1 GerMN domain-containing protein [Clostridium sp.]
MKKYLLTLFALLSLTFFLFSCTNVNDKTTTQENNSNITNNNSTNSDKEINTSSSEEYIEEDIDNKTSECTIVNKNCRIFYYYCSDNCYYYKDTVIPVKDNALISALTEELKKEVKSGVSTLPESLYVKSAKIDRDNDSLTVDLSKDYYDNIKNLGSGPECGILDSIMYTYCYNYNVNNFILLIDGKPYSGNHIILEDGEAFTVNYDNIKEYLNPLE